MDVAAIDFYLGNLGEMEEKKKGFRFGYSKPEIAAFDAVELCQGSLQLPVDSLQESLSLTVDCGL